MGFVRSKAHSILIDNISGTHYVGLSTTTPNDKGENFSEPSPDTGYARSKINYLDYSISAQVANKEIIFFNETLSSWGTITHFGIFDSLEAKTPFFWGELTTPVPIQVTGDTTYVPIFRARALVIGLDKDELEAYE